MVLLLTCYVGEMSHSARSVTFNCSQYMGLMHVEVDRLGCRVCVCVCARVYGAGQWVGSHPSSEHAYPCPLKIARLGQNGVIFALHLLSISMAVHDFHCMMYSMT